MLGASKLSQYIHIKFLGRPNICFREGEHIYLFIYFLYLDMANIWPYFFKAFYISIYRGIIYIIIFRPNIMALFIFYLYI